MCWLGDRPNHLLETLWRMVVSMALHWVVAAAAAVRQGQVQLLLWAHQSEARTVQLKSPEVVAEDSRRAVKVVTRREKLVGAVACQATPKHRVR